MYYYPEKWAGEDIHNEANSKNDLANDYDAFKKDVTAEVRRGLEQIERVKQITQESFDRQKISVIESLSVFVALFTFVSIEFQLFRTATSWLIVTAFTLLFLGGLLLFCGVVEKIMSWDDTPNRIDKFFKTKEGMVIKFIKLLTTRTFVLILLPLLLIICGILLLAFEQIKFGKLIYSTQTSPDNNIIHAVNPIPTVSTPSASMK